MSNEPGQSVTSSGGESPEPVIVDLGKHRKKRIKALRRGRPGKLMDKVMTALDALREDGTVSATAQPIIVVVRERSRPRRWPGL